MKRMNCSNDDFIHTTEERHHRSSEAIWQRMEQNGDIYLGKYAGWYSVRDEAYYAENETHLNGHKVRVSVKTGTPVNGWRRRAISSSSPLIRTSCWSSTSGQISYCQKNG